MSVSYRLTAAWHHKLSEQLHATALNGQIKCPFCQENQSHQATYNLSLSRVNATNKRKKCFPIPAPIQHSFFFLFTQNRLTVFKNRNMIMAGFLFLERMTPTFVPASLGPTKPHYTRLPSEACSHPQIRTQDHDKKQNNFAKGSEGTCGAQSLWRNKKGAGLARLESRDTP